MSTNRYILCTDGHDLPPRPGLGFMIFALAEAALYAHLTERTLVVDWRDTEYTKRKDINLFEALFAPDTSSFGLELTYQDIDATLHGKSRFVVDSAFYGNVIAHWKRPSMEEWERLWSDLARLAGKTVARGDADASASHEYANFPLKFVREDVIATPFIGAVLAYRSGTESIPHKFIERLSLRSPYREAAEDFRRRYFAGEQVVGIHVRHGNGENGHFAEKDRQIQNLDGLLERIKDQIERCKGIDAREYVAFLCSDSGLVIEVAKRKFSRLITREQWRPATNSGCSLHLGHLSPGGEIENAANAAIDMFLLGWCSYLVQVDEGSWFTRVAARRIGPDRVIPVKASVPDICQHVFRCVDLPSAVESRAVGRASMGEAGHLVYGPYVEIDEEGCFCAELSYLTSDCPGPKAGSFEVTVSQPDKRGQRTDFRTLGQVQLPPTHGKMREARVEFDTTGFSGKLLETRVYVEEGVIMNAFHIRTWRRPAAGGGVRSLWPRLARRWG